MQFRELEVVQNLGRLIQIPPSIFPYQPFMQKPITPCPCDITSASKTSTSSHQSHPHSTHGHRNPQYHTKNHQTGLDITLWGNNSNKLCELRKHTCRLCKMQKLNFYGRSEWKLKHFWEKKEIYQVYKYEIRISDNKWCTRAVRSIKIWRCAIFLCHQ